MRKVQKDLLPHPKIALSTPFFIFRKKRRGIALVLTVGILALLVLVGISFTINMMMDLKSSKSFEDSVKAKYLAEAGVNRSINELRYGAGGAIQSAADYPGEAWYSGYSDSSLLDNLGGYSTIIIDCNRQIYINDSLNPNLGAILTNLNTALGSPLTSADISQLITARPAAGYITKEQIKTVLSGSASQAQAKYNAIKDYITIYAFVDPDVISAAYPYAAAPRAPINVNTASRQVLIAVLTGITNNGVNSISSAEASSLADYLIANRPYMTYDDLWTRLLAAQAASIIADGDAAIVMANADPNTDYMSANPNNSWRGKHISKSSSAAYPRAGTDGIDKTQLTVYTTEFCFNSGGYYEITSTGTLRNPGGSQVASKSLDVVVKLFDQWRQTTQAQFEAGVKANVTTYPEPVAAVPAAANYDGQIMLATLKDSTPDSGTHFLVNYNGNSSLNADSGQAFTHLNGKTNPNIASVIDTANRGNMYPDGLYLGDGSLAGDATYDPAYPASGAVDNTIGTAEMWVKSDWYTSDQWLLGTYNCARFLAVTDSNNFGRSAIEFEFWRQSWDKHLSTKTWGDFAASGSLYGANYWGYDSWWARYYYCVYSQQFDNSQWRAGGWHHVAFSWRYWDQGTPTPQGEQWLYCDGYAWNQVARYPTGPTLPFNFIQVGGDAWNDLSKDVECYSTIAGIRIFNSVRTQAQIQADSDRGIYYNAGDASFESAPLSSQLPSLPNNTPARLCNAYWTEHLPAGVPGADMQFDVFDGSNWIGSYSTRTNTAGNSLDRPTSNLGAVKYKAYFITTGTGLLDTPLLDDVTITYTRGARILYLRGV